MRSMPSKAIGLSLAVLVVLACSIVLSFEIASWNRIKPGISVLDVPVGGLTLDEAQARITPRALAILDQPLQIKLDQASWTTSPRLLGVRLDPALLSQSAYAVGRDAPVIRELGAQLDVLRFGYDLPVFSQTDGSQVDALVRQVAREVDKPARDARLVLHDDGAVEFSTSEAGLQLDQASARSSIAQALETGAPTVALTTHPLAPRVPTDRVAAARDQ